MTSSLSHIKLSIQVEILLKIFFNQTNSFSFPLSFSFFSWADSARLFGLVSSAVTNLRQQHSISRRNYEERKNETRSSRYFFFQYMSVTNSIERSTRGRQHVFVKIIYWKRRTGKTHKTFFFFASTAADFTLSFSTSHITH